MQIELHPSAKGFQELASEWNELLADSAADTVFLTQQWQSSWWHHLGDGTPTLIAVRGVDGRLNGLAPLYSRLNNEGEWELDTVGCVDVSDYLDIIVRRGREEPVFAALLDLLEQSDSHKLTWDVVNLCNIPENSPTLSLLGPMAAARGFQVSSQVQEVCPVVTLEGTWDDYLMGLVGKERRELRRKMRRANPHAGVAWYIVGPDHDLQAEVDKFLRLMALSHPDKAEFLHDEHRSFIQEIAQVAWDEGWLELAFLTINGEPAAGMFNFVHKNRTLLYNSGMDAARFLQQSPGIVLTAFLIQHSIENGREAFDFLRGDEAYKYQLGGVDTRIYQLLIRKRA